jgi:hypothetical protein
VRESAGPPAWIAADRDGGELVVLDARLFVAERIAVPWPTHVRTTRAGLWVVSAAHGHPKAAHELRWRAAHARQWTAAFDLPPVLDLESDDSGRALALVRGPSGDVALVRATPQGVELWRELPPDARSLAPCGERIGVAAGAAGLLVLDDQLAAWTCAWSRAGAEVLDALPDDEGWWSLIRDGSVGAATLRWIGFDGSAGAPLEAQGARRIAACAATSSLWILGEGDAWARRIEPASGQELAFARLAALGVAELEVDAGGGLVLAAAGALLRLARDGRPVPGQGGFRRLADLARDVRVRQGASQRAP